MKKLIISTLLATGLCTSATAGPNLGLTIGTRAIAPQVGFSINEQFGLRATFSRYDFDYSTTEDGIDYASRLSLENISFLGDWHPYGGSFRLTAGAVLYGDEIDLLSKPSNGCVRLGESPICRPVNNDDRVEGTIRWSRDVAPYAGLGWGNGAKAGFGFTADIGLIFTDSPQATLQAKGSTFGNDPAVQQDVKEEEKQLNEDLKDAKVWPVINLGVLYAF